MVPAGELSTGDGIPDYNAARNCAAAMLVDDQAIEAGRVADQLMSIDPNKPANWFLKLAVSHAAGDKDEYDKALQQASNAISNRLIEAMNQISDSQGNDCQSDDSPDHHRRPLSAAGFDVAGGEGESK